MMSLFETDGMLSKAGLVEYLRSHRTADAIGQLMPQIAHDLSNLLAVASTNVAVAAAIAPDEKMKGYCEAASASLERIGELAQRLTAVSRLAADPIEVNSFVTDLKEILAERLGAERRLKLLLNAQRDMVEVDAKAFASALLNLVLNAGEALPVGGICTVATHTRTIQWSEQPRECVVVSVVDAGTGMPEDVEAKAFDLLFSTKSPLRGVGLAQVKDFVRRSDGLIMLRSRPERGTAVHFALPLQS